MHLELRVYLSLTAECTLPCIALISVMLPTFYLAMQHHLDCVHTSESVQIQEALTSRMSFMCCL